MGVRLLSLLHDLAARHQAVSEPRGRGLMCAITLPDQEFRNAVLSTLRDREHVLIIGTGARGIRFRPPLTVQPDELTAAVAALDRVLRSLG